MPEQFTVTLNIAAVQGQLQRAIQHVLDLAAFGLIAADAPVPNDLRLPATTVEVQTATDVRLSGEAVRDRFRDWVLANALRDVADAAGGLLDEARKLAALMAVAGRPLTRDEWIKVTETEQRRFSMMPLAAKIETLREKLGVSITDEFLSYLASINNARNCLVHRAGIVGSRDLDSGSDKLCVKWLRMELVAEADGDLRVIVSGDVVEGGRSILLRSVVARKEFAVGDHVRFTTQEFSEICLTLSIYGGHAVEALSRLAKERGIASSAKPETA